MFHSRLGHWFVPIVNINILNGSVERASFAYLLFQTIMRFLQVFGNF